MAGAWIAAISTEAFVVVTAITLLWPGGINSVFGQSYSSQGYCAARGGSCPRERFWCCESSTWAPATSKATE
jgi:hypothetical protein